MSSSRMITVILTLLASLAISATTHSQDINDRLLSAALSGDVAAVKDLLTKGADAKSKQGVAALGRAAMLGHTAIVQALLYRGADVDGKDDGGVTPLMLAATWGRFAVAQALIAKRANVNAKSDIGNTPLILAVGGGDVAIVQALIDKKADINAKNKDGETALIWAERLGHTAIIQILREAGAVKAETTNPAISPGLTSETESKRANLKGAANNAKETMRTEVQAVQPRYRGNWVGKTNQNQSIQFTIDEQNRVTELEVKVIVQFFYNQSCAYSYKIKDPVPIQDRQFDVDLISSAPLGYTDNTSPRIRGSFTSTVAADGSVNQFRVGLAFCGGSMIMGTGVQVGPVSWSAERQVQCATLGTISPNSGRVGSSVVINGTNLGDVTSIKFPPGIPAKFTANSDTQISMVVPSGAASGTISTSQDGCANKETSAFTILESPVPAIASLSQDLIIVGKPGLTLTINGSNFLNGSVIRWNGVDRATQFVNETQLTAQIPAADVASVGKAAVTVFNPAPGGGASSALDFTINPPPNPTPTLSNLSPDAATAGVRGLTLTITGANFINASVVQWNGQDQATTFVSDTQLTTQIPALSLAKAGVVTIKVFNPAPGGGESNEMTFTINRKQTQAQTRGQGRKPVQRPSQRPTKKQ